jgi:hypothetical protein
MGYRRGLGFWRYYCRVAAVLTLRWLYRVRRRELRESRVW